MGRTATRLVLAAGVVAGLAHAATFPRLRPAQVAIATDVYHHAMAAALAGGEFYAVAPPDHPGFRFLYPPVVAAALLPYGVLGPAGAYAVQTALNLASVGALGGLLVWTVEREGVALSRVDRALVVGYAAASVPAVTNVVMGQVNPQLAVGLAAGALLVERGRERAGGAALAAVATVKLFPALVGAWLVRRRAWRAVGAATATGVGLAAAGLLLFGPATTAAYVTETLAREAAAGAFAGGPDPAAPYMTVRRQLAALAPWLPAGWLLPASALVLAPVVLGATRSFGTRRDALVAFQGVVLAVLALFPLEPFYLQLAAFPLVALLYLLEGWPRRLLLAGTLLVSVPATLPTFETWLSVLGLPGWAQAPALAVAERAFAVALPPMVGVWLVLAGCLLSQHRAATTA